MKRSGFKRKTLDEIRESEAHQKPKNASKSRVKKKVKQTYKQKKRAKQKQLYGVKLWSIKTADANFSRYIREQAGYKCERCGYYAAPPTQEIQCSHYIGRSEYATRFDPENCDCLCAKCHAFFENRKMFEYRKWKIEKMGIERHNSLRYKIKNYTSASDEIFKCMKLLGCV